MKKCIMVALFLLALSAGPAYPEIAVLPYRVLNSSVDFPERTGAEYAKLMGLASAIKKGMEVYSPRELELDMKNLSLSPQEMISEDDLKTLGKTRYLDYIILGTLSKVKGSYVAESLLYSLGQQKIVSKSHARADNLFRLAEEDAGEIFINFADRQGEAYSGAGNDVVFLVDASYSVLKEWNSLKKGIAGLAGHVSDNGGIDTRVYIIPFSDAREVPRGSSALNTAFAVKQELERIRPRGGGGSRILESALSYAVKNISWRRNSSRSLVVISNTTLKKEKFLERYALMAKGKGIVVHTVSLGRLGGDDIAALRQLSVIGRGAHLAVAYHQKFYDARGDDIDAYMEAGRLFHTRGAGGRWEEGLFENPQRKGSAKSVRPRPFLTEIDFDEKYEVTPYLLEKQYPALAGQSIIKAGPLEDNIPAVLEKIGDSFFQKAGRTAARKSIGKALVSDGKISLWVNITDQRSMEFFDKQESSHYIFTMGVVVQEKTDEPYGITFNPDYLITGLPRECVPDMSKASLKALIEKSEYYRSQGLFRPPVWFIEVKVERVEKFKKAYDLREQ